MHLQLNVNPPQQQPAPSAAATHMIRLTPPAAETPAIHGPRIYGVRPGSPFHFAISATGARPMTFGADGLPPGLSVNDAGQITGVLAERGEYRVKLKAQNTRGQAERELRIVCGDTIALTPPMGWNSWNCFGAAVTDADIRAAADCLVSSGLADYGWCYINLDDGWSSERNSDGVIQTNSKFPDMKALSDYVHSKGLKIGIYSSPGHLTCAKFPGSLDHEEQDARQYAEWGFDYLKYDLCSCGEKIDKPESNREGNMAPYVLMNGFLKQQPRDIIYSICQYGWAGVAEWAADAGGQVWRTSGDIIDLWHDDKEHWENGMAKIGFSQDGLEKYSGPGRWNDPDMLVVGVVGWGKPRPSRLTPDEQYTHISLWALLAAPLLIGADMTKLDDFTMGLLTNTEVLDINQDPMGKQGRRVAKNGDFQVWARQLEDGSLAVGLFNLGDAAGTIRATWEDLGLLPESAQLVRDVWRNADIEVKRGEIEAEIASHGVWLVRLIPQQDTRFKE